MNQKNGHEFAVQGVKTETKAQAAIASKMWLGNI